MRLVVRGLYRFVRNPMYVGVLLGIFGQALWFGSAVNLWYALGVALIFHLFVVFYEEPALRRKFGEHYVQYCKTVPCWMPKSPKLAATSAPAK
ncbi:MAG: PEMT/PEM2 methyltransferase family protein [Bryobacteraceae bacterium]|jgi:protein-S-isoprenylcysteine O-methyltransferase Ste14